MILSFILLISILAMTSLFLGYSTYKSQKQKQLLERDLQILKEEKLLKEKQIEALELEKQWAELKLTALREQMNPHFIFNALNSIQSFIIDYKVDSAINYLGSLSKLLRGVLESSDKPFIFLKTEIEILKIYLKIESLRFADQTKFQLIIDEQLLRDEIQVPSFSLQPFIENSIKHAFDGKSKNNQVTIEISRSGAHIQYVIIDNGIGRNASLKKNNDSHLSKGVQMVKKKLDMLSDGNYTFEIMDLNDVDKDLSGTKVLIKFPV